ncbi:hypothetical protein VNO77_17747 [Canavalia gladiata]|uniref:Uncharacterized protein n=1 Tax=Canavalia gladiata TaxID=3824 RepID=A0AAN9LJJ7_CANGL
METEETDPKKLQVQVSWIPTTPLNPILPRPVPIWTPRDGNHYQLGSRSNGVHACLECSSDENINRRLHCRSEQGTAAHDRDKTRLSISFDDIPCPGNSFAELLAHSDTPLIYTDATHDPFLENQFVPTFNTLFNPPHLSGEQPLISTIHNQCQDLHGKGNPFRFKLRLLCGCILKLQPVCARYGFWLRTQADKNKTHT